jgi:hypothetical protein
MRKLERKPDAVLLKLLHFQAGKLTDEFLVMETSKHLNDENYTFIVDEEGDFNFNFNGSEKKSVSGYV